MNSLMDHMSSFNLQSQMCEEENIWLLALTCRFGMSGNRGHSFSGQSNVHGWWEIQETMQALLVL